MAAPAYTHIHAHVCLLVQCAGGVTSRLFVCSISSPIQLFYPLVTFFWVGWYDWAGVAGLVWLSSRGVAGLARMGWRGWAGAAVLAWCYRAGAAGLARLG